MIPFAIVPWLVKYARPLAGVAMVVAVLLLVYGVGRSHANRAWSAKHAAAVADWNAAVLKAAEITRAAEADARRTETAWRDHVSQREKEFKNDKAATSTALAAERVSNVRLRDAVDHFVKASSTSSDPSAACGDLRSRIATLGALLQEVDGLAGESAGAADRTRDSLTLCRGYVEALKR